MILFVRKHPLAIIGVLAVLCIGTIIIVGLSKKTVDQVAPTPVVPTKTPDAQMLPVHAIIGKSVEGRNIESYTYGNGKTHLLFVGGIHGGYEWNSVLLAYKFIDYLKENPTVIPKNLSIAIIPSANPDGVFRVTGKSGRFTESDVTTTSLPDGAGRFNARNVDINRNFDCKWKPKSTWKTNIVSAGTHAFSEPEAVAVRNFVATFSPAAAIFWHSKSNAVYASECESGILPVTLDIMNAYSVASGYKAIKSFDAYEISGDAEGWLASINVPAITVELKTHETIEWENNLAGFNALLNYFKKY